MKSSLLVVVLFLILMPLCTIAQKSQKGKAKQSNISKSKAVLSNNNTFYKHYIGSSANGVKAVLDLHRIDSLIFGNYYDNSIDAYVYLTGKIGKNLDFKLAYTDGRAISMKKKELKNFTITGTFLLPDSINAVVSKLVTEKINIKLVANYTDALPFDLYFKQNGVTCKNVKLQAKYLFSMSSLFPSKLVAPITDTIITDLKKIYYPKKYKQIQDTKNKLVESIEATELAAWKKANLAFTTGKSKVGTNTERAERAEIFFNSSNLLSIAYHSYTDNGGAHPSSTELYRNYDIEGKKVLNINTIFSKASISKLPALIAASFLKEYNLVNTQTVAKIADIGLPDELPLPENIAFNQKGVFFIYNDGELGISYTSKVVVFIEFNELKPYVEPSCALVKLF